MYQRLMRDLCMLLLVGCLIVPVSCSAQLDQQFKAPPASAKPWTWWHWMNGNITKTGITNDLEAMKEVGLGGAEIFDVTDGILPGPVKYMSPEWLKMVHHACKEADRLGLELCIHNCAGWSSSGGPWVTPELSMQMVTYNEMYVTGPQKLAKKFTQPATRLNTYKDIAILAFPTPAAEINDSAKPKITCSDTTVNLDGLADSNTTTQVMLPVRKLNQPVTITWEYAKPVTMRSVKLLVGGTKNAPNCEVQAQLADGNFKTMTSIWLPEPDYTQPYYTSNFDGVTSKTWRISFTRKRVDSSIVIPISEFQLSPGFRISDINTKAGWSRGSSAEPDNSKIAEDLCIAPQNIVNLTDNLSADGTLNWEVPAGDWTILRIGHTPTGKTNHPASVEGEGLECDKLSREAADHHWNGVMAPVLKEIGPLAGRSLKHVLIDSYEVYCQNWTPKMPVDFSSRTGYDILQWLPVLTGRVVGDREQSERFLWDYRRVLADLFNTNYFGRFAELAHQHNLLLSVEPYGNGNFDDLTAGGKGDIPMGEFWVGMGFDSGGGRLAASVAHTYGLKYVGAESFTADSGPGRWQNHPYSMKALGDCMYTGGINRFIFHRYAHQPWEGLLPGMTMGPHGFHFERTLTWWKQAPAWTTYLTRCQFLLQEGKFVADAVYYIGEASPSTAFGRGSLNPGLPDGYDFDSCDTDVLINRMSVKNGQIVLPDGMSYRVLVLPARTVMSPSVLEKVRKLIYEGATVVGPRPVRSASRINYPNCDATVKRVADEIWGDIDGKNITERRYGYGRVIYGQSMQQVMDSFRLKPDFEVLGNAPKSMIQRIHRKIDNVDVYFVACASSRSMNVECAFRVKGMIPELWSPDTGEIREADAWTIRGGRTIVPIRFEPAGSVFVVFRQPARSSLQIASIERNGKSIFAPPTMPGHKLVITRAEYGALNNPQMGFFNITSTIAQRVKDNKLQFKADNILAGGDPAPDIIKQCLIDYAIDGKKRQLTIDENATATLPAPGDPQGKLEIIRVLYGLLPDESAPINTTFIDMTDKLNSLIKDGQLSTVADNALAGSDPAQFVVKSLRVEYTVDGKPAFRTFTENEPVALPDGTELGQELVNLPPPTLSRIKGEWQLKAWESGSYQATTGRDVTLKADVASLFSPFSLEGPWTVKFLENRGAPVSAEFDKLVSWTERPEEGIRYFSGTATYHKEFNIPSNVFKANTIAMLNLGRVGEIAQVRLNGKDLGIFWKPPFCIEVTDNLRPGRNVLEVEVTNMWVNRLIGDEQYPADAEFAVMGPMLQWPDWLLKGEARPVTSKRVTFTTWKHFDVSHPLMDSGLMGPVKIVFGKIVNLK